MPRKDRTVTFRGKTQTLAAWARELEMPRRILYERLYLWRWSVREALTLPTSARRSVKEKWSWRNHLDHHEAEEMARLEGALEAADLDANMKAALKRQRYVIQQRGSKRARLAEQPAASRETRTRNKPGQRGIKENVDTSNP